MRSLHPTALLSIPADSACILLNPHLSAWTTTSSAASTSSSGAPTLPRASPSFARDNGWWDMKRTRDCLARKRILLLGDSTMGEMFHDLAILLSGAAASQDTTVNSIIMDEYVKKATTPQGRNEDREWTYELKNDVYIKFYCCRRRNTYI